jgi:hypothetical protein
MSSSIIHGTAHLNHSNLSCCSHHGNLNCSTGRCRRRRRTAGTAAGGLHASNQHASAQHPPSPPTVLAASAAVPAVLPGPSPTPPFPPPLRRWCPRRRQRRDISGRPFFTFPLALRRLGAHCAFPQRPVDVQRQQGHAVRPTRCLALAVARAALVGGEPPLYISRKNVQKESATPAITTEPGRRSARTAPTRRPARVSPFAAAVVGGCCQPGAKHWHTAPCQRWRVEASLAIVP